MSHNISKELLVAVSEKFIITADGAGLSPSSSID